MGTKSNIEWTDASWTPIRAKNLKTGKLGWHCEHDTTGCIHCYSEAMNLRLGTGLPFKPGHRKDVEIFLDEKMLQAPLHWKKPRMVFVCSMTDLFADFMKDEWIDRVFAVMALCPQHTFQVLTKRAERMRDYCLALPSRSVAVAQAAVWLGIWDDPDGIAVTVNDLIDRPLPNLWLGVSAERQQEADERIPLLLRTPAAIRFISAEPLLGPIDLCSISWPKDHVRFPESDDISGGFDALRLVKGTKLDWVIVGGESGHHARPMHPQWARDIRDHCEDAGLPLFFKQWGNCVPIIGFADPDRGDFCFEGQWFARIGKKAAGRFLDGVEYNGFPESSG
jgi:protein gp37